MTKGGSSPVIVENGGNKMDGGVATPTVKKRGFFSGSFRRRRSTDVKSNDTIIINENVVFNGGNAKNDNGKATAENGCKSAVEPQHLVNDKKPPLQQKIHQQQQTENKKADKKVDAKKQLQQQQQQQTVDKKKSTAAVDDKKKAVTKRGKWWNKIFFCSTKREVVHSYFLKYGFYFVFIPAVNFIRCLKIQLL